MSIPTRTLKALMGMNVVKVDEGQFIVESGTTPGKWYHVEIGLGRATCECPDATHREVVCKHARAAAIQDARGEVKTI